LNRVVAEAETLRQALLVNPAGLDAGSQALASDAFAFRDSTLEHTWVRSGLVSRATRDAYLRILLRGELFDPLAVEAAGPAELIAGADSCTVPSAVPLCAVDVGPIQSGLPGCLTCFRGDRVQKLQVPEAVSAVLGQRLCAGLTSS